MNKDKKLAKVLEWESMTRNEYIQRIKTLDWQVFDKKLWHRNYHEHIIHNEKSYQHISEYIINNPANLGKDIFL